MSQGLLDDEMYAAMQAAASMSMAYILAYPADRSVMTPQLTQRERELIFLLRNAGAAYRRARRRAHLTSVPEVWKTDAAPRIVDALLGAT